MGVHMDHVDKITVTACVVAAILLAINLALWG